MKKLLLLSAIGFSVFNANAHGPNHHGHYGHYGQWGWVAPALISGAIVYGITRPPVVQQPPVVIQQPVIPPGQVCGPWTEIRNPDGSVTVTRTCQ